VIEGLKGLQAEIDKTFNFNEGNFNLKRAEQFKAFAQSRAKKGQLGMRKIKRSTIRTQGFNHPPLFRYGRLIDYMRAEKHRNGMASAGYYVKDKTKYPNERLTYYKLAKLHTTGFKHTVARPLVYKAFSKYHPKEKKFIKFLMLKTWGS